MPCPFSHPSDDPPLIEYTVEEDESVSIVVVEAVAIVSDSLITDLPPLYEEIDPDALNALFATRQTDVSAEFQYQGYLICIHADDTISIHQNQ